MPRAAPVMTTTRSLNWSDCPDIPWQIVTATASTANPYPAIKAYEQREYNRLSTYLEGLDPGGWVEQSYCSDWLVYQVVSHIGSGSRIGALRVEAWAKGGPQVTREAMQE